MKSAFTHWANLEAARDDSSLNLNLGFLKIQCSMSPTMATKGCKMSNFCLIVSTAAHLSIKFKITNRCGKKLAYLKPPDSVQRPRVSRYGLKTLICSVRKSYYVFIIDLKKYA